MSESPAARAPRRAGFSLSALRTLLPVALLATFSLILSAPSLGLVAPLRPWLLPLLGEARLEAYQARKVQLGLDLSGGMDSTYRASSSDPEVISAAAQVLRARLALDGISGAEVRVQGADQIRAQVPCQDEARCQELREILETTDLLEFHQVLAEAPSPALLLPREGTRVLPLRPEEGRGENLWFVLQEPAALSGDHLAEVRVAFDPLTGDPVLHLRFDDEGTRRFADLSRQTVGRRVAVVLGGEVVTAPVMEQAIPNGQAVLRGRFQIDEARRLVRLLEAGSLPVPLVRLSRSTVGPTLGGESVVQSARAAAAGMAAVVVYTGLWYGRAGVVAGAGLVLNLLLQVAVLEGCGAALTLPGFAGIALTVGMAVDANVLCFERIREERAAGKSPRSARAAGFSKAWSAIVDSNLTTLLTALVLFLFGSGPVKGFAVTLGIGLASSLVASLWAVQRVLDAFDLSP